MRENINHVVFLGGVYVKIGYRTLKTAIAAPLAILIAELLQLEGVGSAGIIAVLCIQPTRKQSFLTAWHRIAAGLLSIVFAFVIFEGLGYNPLTVGILLILFIPVTNWLKIAPGIVTSLVILFHFYAAETVDIPLVINEIALMFIGIGLALILNLYMPNLDNSFQEVKNQVEANYQQLFREIAGFLRGDRATLSLELLAQTRQLFNQASDLVQRDQENNFNRQESWLKNYFAMREIQLLALERMAKLIKPKLVTVKQAQQIADLFDDMADAIYPTNPVQYHLEQVDDLLKRFERQDLPQTREEFEVRADLFQLLTEINHYLTVKNQTIKTANE